MIFQWNSPPPFPDKDLDHKRTASVANLRQIYFKRFYKYGCHQVLYRKQTTETEIQTRINKSMCL